MFCHGLSLGKLLGLLEHEVHVGVEAVKGAPEFRLAPQFDGDGLAKGVLQHLERFHHREFRRGAPWPLDPEADIRAFLPANPEPVGRARQGKRIIFRSRAKAVK